MRCLSPLRPPTLAAALLALGLAGCGGKPTTTQDSGKGSSSSAQHGCVIEVPKTSDETQKKISAEIAAKLGRLAASTDLKGAYDSTVKTEYGRLSDENMALLLFLNAIHCYLQDGKVGEAIANQMAETVRQRWAAKKGISGTTPKLSPLEMRHIRESPYAAELTKRLQEFHLED